MKVYKKELATTDAPLVAGFDVEWTKNYQMKNANKAFCFSLVWISLGSLCDLNTLERELEFGFVLGYCEAEAECQQLCQLANTTVSAMLSPENMIVGHQFSSDVSVLLACSECRIQAVEDLQHSWRTRQFHTEERRVAVFDTRYDLTTSKHAASNKLVNVCPQWNLIVTQPEIKGSMTKMQRELYLKGHMLTLEKIAVLNLRHSLSSVLLYLFHRSGHHGHVALIDSYYDKLMTHYIQAPHMDWLIAADDPYYNVLKQMALVDNQMLPAADIIILFTATFASWEQCIMSRKRQLDVERVFPHAFPFQAHLLRAAQQECERSGSRVLLFENQFGSIEQAVERLHKLLMTYL